MESRSLSPLESRIILTAESTAKAEVDISDIQAWAGITRNHARRLAHNLSKKYWLQRVGRGRYLVNPSTNGPERIPDRDPWRIGSRLVAPYHFSHATAANLHGLLKQRFQDYVISTPRRKRIPKDLPIRVRFVTTYDPDPEGTETKDRRGVTIRLSDREQTVLECVGRPDLVGGISHVVQVVASAKPDIRWNHLVELAKHNAPKSTVQRLGWILDHVRPDVAVPILAKRNLQKCVGTAFVQLDQQSQARGPTDKKWRIQRNRDMPDILSEVRIS